MFSNKHGVDGERITKESLHLARYTPPESKPLLHKVSIKSRFFGFCIGSAASLVIMSYIPGMSGTLQTRGFWISLLVFTVFFLVINYILHRGE